MSGVADGFHPPLEEYLEAIHELEEEGTPVIQARLVERLDHSPPAVSEMVRRLRDAGYVALSGRTVGLTPLGRELGESVVRKHRLAERLLTDIIGLPWENAHVEACRWEHVISDDVASRLEDLLGHPTTCPHGNPIPGTGPDLRRLVPLAGCVAGQLVRLERVTEQIEIDRESLAYLSDHGFVPGVEAVISSRAPDGTLTLDIAGRGMALSPILAQQMHVVALQVAPAQPTALLQPPA
jgi:DtxR family Mn-dependent transcriptional regulator